MEQREGKNLKTLSREGEGAPKGRVRRLFLTAAATFIAFQILHASEQVKLAVERALEERVQSAISKLIDPSQYLLVIKVEPYSPSELTRAPKAKAAQSGDILPGIPQRTTLLDKGSESPAAVYYDNKPLIKRMMITLFLDKSISSDLSQQVEVLVKQLTDFSADRRDEFKIQTMELRRGGAAPNQFELSSPVQSLKVTVDQLKGRADFYWILMFMGFLAILGVFFVGLTMYFRRFVDVWQKAFMPDMAKASSGGGAAPRGNGGAGGNGGGGLDSMGTMRLQLDTSQGLQVNLDSRGHHKVEIFQGEPEKQNFNFINDKDLVNVLLLLKEEPSLHLAIIAYHLRPDIAAAFIAGLDDGLRKQVVDHLAAPQVLMRDEVKELGKSLKTRVRGIVYGIDQYFAIYDSSSSETQGDLMKSLEMQTPALVEKMKSEMFTFDDLMALEANALRIVFREVPLKTLATALLGGSLDMRDKILGVLPAGAAEIIRQEIEMNPGQSQKNIEAERKKIVGVVRRLVWDKKIASPPRYRSARMPMPTIKI
jgi:hypothetical protein